MFTRMTPATDAPTSPCDQEQIHAIQLVQQRGVLIAAAADRTIQWVSDNCARYCAVTAQNLLGQSLAKFLTEQQVKTLYSVAKKEKALTVPITFHAMDYKSRFNCLTYLSGDSLVLELEHLGLESEEITFEKNNQLSKLLKFDRSQSTSQLLQTLAEGVAGLTDFDKVMVYRFHPDWHGEVVAETNSVALPNYLGLHFPASDIPAPARELFKANWVRQIADVEEESAKLLGAPGAEPLTLWISGLRSAAPIHIEYLQNMGIGASLTLSLMCEGELWGLIACHNVEPKITPLWTRSMCEILAKAASFQITKTVAREFETAQLQTVQAFDRLQLALINASDPVAFTTEENSALCALTESDSCVLMLDNKLYGSHKLDFKLVHALIERLSSSVASHIVCENLASIMPEFEKYPAYSGLLASRVDMERNSWLIWFRPEYKQNISWGGNPDKTVTEGLGKNHPRASFQEFLQQVKLHSQPWNTIQVTLARNLSFLVTQKILGKTISLGEMDHSPSTYLITLLSDISAPINHAISTLSALLKNDTQPEDREMLERVIEFHEKLKTTINEYVSSTV